ncbi:MAG: nuclear transport factor 2 family protein [Woeseiaceae bacterium]
MLLLTSILLALAASADVTAIDLDKDVLAAQSARITATLDADIDALEKIYAEELVYSHSDGRVDDRQILLNAIASGTVDYKKIDIVEQQIRIYGEVAVINGTADFRVLAGEQMNEMRLRYTSVYVYQAGGWQFASWHSTRVPNVS